VVKVPILTQTAGFWCLYLFYPPSGSLMLMVMEGGPLPSQHLNSLPEEYKMTRINSSCKVTVKFLTLQLMGSEVTFLNVNPLYIQENLDSLAGKVMKCQLPEKWHIIAGSV